MEEQIREKVKVSAVCDQDSLKFERREGKEQHCYTSITKTCQTQRTSLETSTYPFLSLKLFIFEIIRKLSRITAAGFQLSCQHIAAFQSTPAQHIFSLSLSTAIFISLSSQWPTLL